MIMNNPRLFLSKDTEAELQKVVLV